MFKNISSKKQLDKLTYEVIGAAIEVQQTMGRGLLESVYHECMCEELTYRRINFQSELKIPVKYRNKELNIQFRCDFLIEDCLILELKSAHDIMPIYEAQLINYMNLLRVPKGLLINFNCWNIYKEGQKTFVNEYFKLLKP